MSEVQFDKSKIYSLVEAAELLPKLSTSKFIGSVNIDIVLNVSEKQKKETISGSITFPHQVGAGVKVAVVTGGDNQAVAKEAGADKVGFQDLIKEIESGVIDFDVLVATPDAMPLLAKLGKVLGPRSLMPSPKNETVTTDVAKTVKSYKAGKQNFKSSEQLAVRARIAKLDMKPEQIAENAESFIRAVYEEAKKFGNQPFKKITLSPTMGAGVKIDVSAFVANS